MKRILIVAAITMVAIASFAYHRFSQHKEISHDSRPSNPPEVDVEAFKALPYTQWAENADAKLRGVTRLDAGKVSSGYNIFTNDVDEVYLLDMKGKKVHQWKLPPKHHCEHAELLKNGDVLVVCAGYSLFKLDWNGNILWQNRTPSHHDLSFLEDGSILTPSRSRYDEYQGRKVRFDSITHISESGKTLDVWSTFQNLKKIQKFHPLTFLDSPPVDPNSRSLRRQKFDYYHMNRAQALPQTQLGKKDSRFRAGNILVGLRNVSTILILDQKSREIVWHLGDGLLEFQHTPTMLENGNILIFDNGRKRKYSRVLEIEPSNKKIVWKYEGNPKQEFYSAWRGSAQRLSNGNTLICDSEKGHVFELDSGGNIVWEFWNPEIQDGRRQRIYRLMRIPNSIVDPLLRK